MHIKKPRRSPLRLRFLLYILEEISCASCIGYFPTVPKSAWLSLPPIDCPIKTFMNLIWSKMFSAGCASKLSTDAALVQHCANSSEYSTCYLHQSCVVVSQQCHRIASFLRLALSQISGTVFHCYLGNAVLEGRRSRQLSPEKTSRKVVSLVFWHRHAGLEWSLRHRHVQGLNALSDIQ